MLARPARAVALAFVEASRHLPRRARTVVTGNPVRPAILAVADDRASLAKEAYEEFDLDPAGRTIVVFGGSQGALHVNRAIAETVARATSDGVQFLLLTGPAHEASVRRVVEASARVPVRVRAFLERMELAYAIADLVVARAGATTVAEISVCGVPGILIPYPHATGRHQDANARALERAGGASVVLDDELDGPVLAERIETLLGDPERLRPMAERTRAWSKPEAAEALARAVTTAGGTA
jgi:UDP-N-acetylglucosamine--N-acetylmuramyl-(pentapeptide) pyrophosphoryl-undecaprenol N-acetylglucosamine transferase